jgi:hypothetical protein
MEYLQVRTLVSATNEFYAQGLHDRRQTFGITTIENDSLTLYANQEAYRTRVQRIRQAGVKDVVWNLTLQPLLPGWVRKSQSNPLDLQPSV